MSTDRACYLCGGDVFHTTNPPLLKQKLDEAREEGRREILALVAGVEGSQGHGSPWTDLSCFYCGADYYANPRVHEDSCLWVRAVMPSPLVVTAYSQECRICGSTSTSMLHSLLHKPSCAWLRAQEALKAHD